MPVFVSQTGCGETKGKQACIFDKPSGSEERVPFCCLYYFIFCHFYLVLPVTSLIIVATTILTCDLAVFHNSFFPNPLPPSAEKKKKTKRKKRKEGKKMIMKPTKKKKEKEELLQK